MLLPVQSNQEAEIAALASPHSHTTTSIKDLQASQEPSTCMINIFCIAGRSCLLTYTYRIPAYHDLGSLNDDWAVHCVVQSTWTCLFWLTHCHQHTQAVPFMLMLTAHMWNYAPLKAQCICATAAGPVLLKMFSSLR